MKAYGGRGRGRGGRGIAPLVNLVTTRKFTPRK